MRALTDTMICTVFFLSLIFPRLNALANCPASCACDEQNLMVNCGEGQLDVLPIALNPSINRLIIQKNKIKTIDSSVQFYSELVFLDLSYNHLYNIPPRTFMFQKKLKELHLNHNKIGAISNGSLSGLSALVILNLGNNYLNELGANAFSTLPKLEELNLSRNRINFISDTTFNGLKNLKILYLNDNSLSMVPIDAFTPLGLLAELYLGINVFTTIENGAFERLNLSLLDLKGSGLQNISEETFRGLEDSLKKLDISDNRLPEIPTKALFNLNRLEELILGQNSFDSIPSNALAGLINLRNLDISGSLKLQKIEKDAFAANSNLDTLVIVSNKALSDIQSGSFSGLPHLKNIDLRDNALTLLPEDLLNWNELNSFDLSQNPLVCDCKMLWLRALLSSQNTSQASADVLCAAPETVRDLPLRTLAPSLIGCNNDDAQKQILFSIVLVTSVAILTILVLLLIRCRRRIREVFKDRWGDSALGNKEREYQKTFSDEDYMHANARNLPCTLGLHQPTSQLGGYSHQYHQPGIRPIPVTEL